VRRNENMKVAITSKGETLDSEMDPRFGRCAYFIIIDADEVDNYEAISNEAVTAPGGAGVMAAQTVIDKGVEAIISGNFGPKAFDALSGSGIKLYTVNAGTVKESLDALVGGAAKLLDSATAAAHAGLRRI
jgi:predicted Fe-Mo cluster-binding NifX family protein